jgi:tyrosine-protein kinase Etk/Wzc
MDKMEFNLWKLLEVIALRIKLIIGFVLAVTVIAVIVAFALPRWYMASTLLLPPKEESLNLGQSRGLEDMISITSGLVLPIRATPTDVYARILRSRNIGERVINSNNLMNHFDKKSMADAQEELNRRTGFQVTEEGLLEITYIDKDPVVAAAVSNSFAEELDKMNRELSSLRAKITREFISQRLSEVSADLDSARLALRDFQSSYKAIDLDQQTQLAVQSAINLKVSLAQNEIELNVKEKSLSPTHPEVIELRRTVDQIKNQISALEYGGQDNSYLSLPIAEVPSLKIKFAELSGRVRIAEALFQILSEQFEQVKIQEKRDTPTLSILDKALPPELPYRPQKTIIVLVCGGLSIFLAIFMALFLNYLINLKKNSPDDYNRVRLFVDVLLGWLPGMRSRRDYNQS